jgi:hypothetical protein
MATTIAGSEKTTVTESASAKIAVRLVRGGRGRSLTGSLGSMSWASRMVEAEALGIASPAPEGAAMRG